MDREMIKRKVREKERGRRRRREGEILRMKERDE